MDGQTKELRLDTGIVRYTINDAYTVEFNPTDSVFVEKLYSTFEELDKQQEAHKAEITNAKNGEIFDIARKRDAEMRGMIDAILGEGCCAAVFGGMNLYALGNGLPVWANLLLAIIDEVNDLMEEEKKKSNSRIEKYTKKYHR